MKRSGMKNWGMPFLVVLMVLITAPAVGADSLWVDSSACLYRKSVHLFQPGDLLTIIVVEQATATQNATSSNSEGGGLSAGPGIGGWQRILPMFGTDWDSSYQGKGATTRGGSLTAKLTVEIREITPTGILVLEGRQEIRVNSENQILTIKGKVRSEDVSADNIVISSNISDAVIEYQGKGTVGEAQTPGILTKFFHWLL